MCPEEPHVGPGTDPVLPMHLLLQDQDGSRSDAGWGTDRVSVRRCCCFLSPAQDHPCGAPVSTWKPRGPAQLSLGILFSSCFRLDTLSPEAAAFKFLNCKLALELMTPVCCCFLINCSLNNEYSR